MGAGRQHRLALNEPARLAPNDWSSVEIRLLECTATDFRAAGDIRLKVNTAFMIELPVLGQVRAWVTWSRPGEFAATFAEPIDLARMRGLSLNREAVLARLLDERAAAHAAGRHAEERALRSEILHGLPVRSPGDPA
jgi:hypothetical protein